MPCSTPPLLIQVKALRQGSDVVVATPGRLEDLVQEGSCKLSGVTYLVLDEADRMLDLGFEPHIRLGSLCTCVMSHLLSYLQSQNWYCVCGKLLVMQRMTS